MTARSGGLYDQLQRENRRATRVLLTLGTLLVALLVWLVVGYLAGPEVAFSPVPALGITAFGTALGLGGTFLSMRAGPAIALRAAKAKPADRERYRELHNVFDEVCVSAGISGTKPKLYVVEDPAPNAFATGLSLDNSHVAVTTGLLERLPRYELRAVLAHEVAHILNDDIRAVTVAVATAGLVALLADVLIRAMWLGGGRGGRSRSSKNQGGGGAAALIAVLGILAVILAPIAAQLIRFAVSRQREYLADATAADLLRDPQSMVNALRRIDGDTTEIRHFEVATAHLWFEEPNETRGKDRAAKMARRFATHPSMRERIERLASLNAGTVRTDAPLPPRPDAPRGPAAPDPSTRTGGPPPPPAGGPWPPPPGGGWPPPPARGA
ncbi:M48 family metallopeptidase [Nitriliruptor alkaliphilus]|uniref:M48 family metallopeptidase n=1 Tax=Nitriliruptor alkaliphilus TaxID=427918 RepID=UPI0006980651|nr:M48 family metallopeptidase [Nitriliruptor alkaliphilus]